MERDCADRRGFALIVVLVLLMALYAGGTGLFLAARAELHSSLNHAAAERAFHAAEGGLATWMAASVQPATAQFVVGEATVTVIALPILALDSATVLYLIEAGAEIGDAEGASRLGLASRSITLLGLRRGSGAVAAVPGTWRERF